uniref:Uncharacterized protein n=1 Tax=Kalanchoe fedtschenkoi TaxID=63787 RepID=A0A7N0ZVQ9_KALFE
MESGYPNPITPASTRIGWIGIGVMGSAMAARLLSAGYSLTVYARTPSRALALQTLGARLADSTFELARVCDVVFTMVSHPSDVRQVVLGEGEGAGVLSGIGRGGVTVDHTSSHPRLAAEIFEAARLKGCWSVDAPVSGADVGAANGKLAILAGGDEDVVRWLLPLFDLMGRATYMGKAGCGQSCKVANQIAVAGNLLGLCEGLMFAKKAGGLDLPQWVESVKDGAAGSMVMELFGGRMLGRDFESGGLAEYIVKDLGMAAENGEDEEGAVVLPGAALSKQLFHGMVANGDGKLGLHGLVSVLERLNGCQI